MDHNSDGNVKIRIDAGAKGGELAHFWRATGYANADFTYTPAFRRMYDYLSSYTGHARYMRVHNILTLHGEGDRFVLEWNMPYGNRDFGHDNRQSGDDKVVALTPAGELVYNWELVDRVYDVMTGHGMAPIVELVYLPSALYRSEEEFFVPRDYRLYAQMIGDFVRHCRARYGEQALREWYFEIWNEPDGRALWREDPSTFLAMYDYAENAIHTIDAALRVGGPATMQADASYSLFEAFVKHCAGGLNYCTGTFGARVDFFSVHCKGGRPSATNPSTSAMFDSVARYLDILERWPQYHDTEFFNDESDIIWNGNQGIRQQSWLDFRNTHYAPGFVCKMVSLYCTRVLDRGVRLTVADSDNCHLQWERSLFSGNRSQLTPLRSFPSCDVIKKPFFNAYVLLAKLGGERIAAECGDEGFGDKFGVLATRGGARLAAMVWNFEDGMTEAVGTRSFSAVFSGLSQGEYDAVEYRIDAAHSNANAVWRALGAPTEPTAAQIAQLRERDGLELAAPPARVRPENGTWTWSAVLPQHAVALVLLVPHTEAQPAPVRILCAQAETGSAGNRQVFLKWTPGAEPELLYYRVLRGEDGGPLTALAPDGQVNTATFVDMTVRQGHRYTYRVVPVSVSGAAGAPGEDKQVEA